VPYDTATGRYYGDSAGLALEGEYRIATPQGEAMCHPAFELYTRLCRHYPPEAVEGICRIPRAQVEEAARLIWHARAVSYYAWSGHEQHANVTQTARAMSLLYALTGCFDMPGGNVLFPAPAAAPITGEELMSAGQTAATWASPSARSGQHAGATSAPAISTGPFWRGSPTRCVR